MASADWLSPYIVVASDGGKPISEIKFRNQIASRVADARAEYSASAVESATVGCLLEFHVIAVLLMRKV